MVKEIRVLLIISIFKNFFTLKCNFFTKTAFISEVKIQIWTSPSIATCINL